MIYADNAATTKLDKAAYESMKPFLMDAFGNASQPYSFSREPKKALRDSRQIIANCIGATPEEIFFTSGGTESDNWAIKGAAFRDPNYRPIVTSSFEHHAVLNSCATIERMGYPVRYLSPEPNGQVSPTRLKAVMPPDTQLVSIMYGNNEIGSIQPIRALSEIAHRQGALFHTDAVQAVGHVKIDVNELGVDLLSASAHKFNGPKGIGFLYIRRGTNLCSFMDGGSQEYGYRAGTENIASIVGMATALKINVENMEQNQLKLRTLEKRLLSGIQKLNTEYLRNGGENTLPGIMSLSFKGKSGETILHRMDLMGINISTGSACDSVNTEVSHVLRAINLDNEFAEGTIRISLGRDNTEQDVDEIVAALKRIVS